MATFISFSLGTLAVLLAIPVAIFLIEVVAAIALPQRDCLVPPSNDSRRRVAVLIPAHNESSNLLPTLADIKAQIREDDRLLVVADNCSDDTAAVAAAADVDVIDRNDPVRKGKGYALDWGLRHLSLDPPDIVIMVDADCRLAAATIDQLAATCAVTQRPVQALYLMISSDESPINSRVAEFGWRVKNWVRPLGLRALGLPCQLMGTGMAFPWDLISSADLASGLIVEDLKLGLDLASAGSAPVFYPFASVTSYFPWTLEGTDSQRLRWERGHIGMIFAMVPRMIVRAVAQANLGLLTLAFDLAVPPPVLLGMLLMAMSVITGSATFLGTSCVAMFISLVSLIGFISAIFISWLTYGRDILPLGSILLVFSYALGKLPFYLRILLRKSSSQWIRTDRRKI